MTNPNFSRRRGQTKFQLIRTFERLEARQLLAGDVADATSDIPDDAVPAEVSSQQSAVEHTTAQPPTQTNPANALDVNADGHVSPIDALLVINALNRNSHR
jgi:hypothetical protein